ncbi:galactokinase [Spongiimicrobium salis]|uniref:galactokinase n=1 Tax=Spongiimicrobium salis TaxID=1667022 RepID=UPI00374CCF88
MQFLKDFEPSLSIASPGRINIIGEHTDYNLGYVLPTAIEKKITFNFQRNTSDRFCNVYSKGLDSGFTVNLKEIRISEISWENYILGVLYEISKKTDKLRGFDCTIESHVPIGSGVSSSAALECGLAYGLNELFHLELPKETLVALSRDAEHHYVGTKCGIMDQFASVMSRKDHVILLDCKSLEYRFIPLAMAPYKIVLLNTNVSHNLATSGYNTRREECDDGVKVVQLKYPAVTSLRDVTEDMLEDCRYGMTYTVYRRCKYVLQENKRVLAAVQALQENNLEELGRLMYATHHGLQHEYEVSCPELDFLVDFSKSNEQVLGARCMGGGFGGCTINIVHENAVEVYIQKISEAYEKAFGIQLTAFEASPSEGTSIKFKK